MLCSDGHTDGTLPKQPTATTAPGVACSMSRACRPPAAARKARRRIQPLRAPPWSPQAQEHVDRRAQSLLLHRARYTTTARVCHPNRSTAGTPCSTLAVPLKSVPVSRKNFFLVDRSLFSFSPFLKIDPREVYLFCLKKKTFVSLRSRRPPAWIYTVPCKGKSDSASINSRLLCLHLYSACVCFSLEIRH